MRGRIRGSWAAAAAMGVYAVQLTMVGAGIAAGERPGPRAYAGLALAILGLAALAAPSAANASPGAAALMVLAGVCWGIYSLLARRVGAAIADTAGNFARVAPLAVVLWWLAGDAHATTEGYVLAAASGALASGLGYAIWAAAMPYLRATSAAVAQLLVPVLAAIGAVLFLGESLTPRLALCGGAILAGVALALTERVRR